jgi:uncharacterized protein (TIGR00369 family)
MLKLPQGLRQLDFRGSSVAWIREAWRLLRNVPGGKNLYGRLLGQVIPYTGTIRPVFITLEPGHAVVRLDDRRAVRNHLGSIHAIALCNLAELAGNAAIACSLPDSARFIVKRIEIDYLKKARGSIVASCTCPVSLGSERAEYHIEVELKDDQGTLVSKVRMVTLVGPIPTST